MKSAPSLTSTGGLADIEVEPGVIRCVGVWTLEGVEHLDQRLEQLPQPAGEVVIDGSRIRALDTSGVLLLHDIVTRLAQQGSAPRLVQLREEHQELLAWVVARAQAAGPPAQPEQPPGPIAALGKTSWDKIEDAVGFLAFLGETSLAVARALAWPARLRWQTLFANIETAGLRAMPIVGLLSFLIGVVIAYQGGNQLRYYGANIFIVELVTLTMVRELAPLIAAIIVAGRTGSSYTAQIGTMQVTEEVDALRTIGIDPFDMLVLPKLFGLLVVLPLLTVFADMLSVFGGMVVAALWLDVSFQDFLNRIPQVVSLFSFLFGIMKAPVFAGVVALVGCYQGFQVYGGADSVGRQTTQSVVQAIFLVIVVDALFAMFLGTVGF